MRSTLSTSSRGTEDFSLAHILPGLPGCHGNLAAVGTVATPVPASAATTSPPERALSGKTLTVDELSVVQESRRLPVLRAVVCMYLAVWLSVAIRSLFLSISV